MRRQEPLTCRQGDARKRIFALAHAPTRDHLMGDGGDMVQVIFCVRGDTAERYLFGG